METEGLRVELRGEMWNIVDFLWCSADPANGKMTDFVGAYVLEDDHGTSWDWDNDPLTEEEDKLIDGLLSGLTQEPTRQALER